MITDEERREVARRLREYASWYVEEDCLVDCADWGERVLNLLGCGDMEGECYAALADLIEPPARCPHYMHPCCRTDAGGDYIDRDALLKLADDMDAYTACDDERCGKEMPPSVIHDYARRIREALGVRDD